MAGAEGAQKKGSVELTFTTVLTFVFLVIAAMTAAYVWGVMSGRHLALEAAAMQAQTQASQHESEIAPKTNGDILKPQELDFVNALRDEAAKIPPKARETEKTDKNADAKLPENLGQPVSEPMPSPPAVSAQPPETSGAYFDFIFQVAALKDEQAADNLREKLEGRGLRTRLERAGKIYLILVLLRGDESRASEVRQIVNELRLGDPLLRSKKPV